MIRWMMLKLFYENDMTLFAMDVAESAGVELPREFDSAEILDKHFAKVKFNLLKWWVVTGWKMN